MIIAERAARVEAEAVAARAQAVNTSTEVLIAHLKLEIEKLRALDLSNRPAAERRDDLLADVVPTFRGGVAVSACIGTPTGGAPI